MTASSVRKTSKRKLEISFGGCGFLGVYHIGVGKCVVDHVPHLFDEFSGFYGASAGAITAVCAACKSDPMVPYKWVKKTFEASREYKLLGALHPSFNLYGRLREFLEGFLPTDAHMLCRNKVKISMTTFNDQKTLPEPRNWLVSNFTTRTELINVRTCMGMCNYTYFTVFQKWRLNLGKMRSQRCGFYNAFVYIVHAHTLIRLGFHLNYYVHK